MEDQKIIELFFARSELASQALAAKYEKLLYKISFHILQDSEDVAECLNDTYLGVWNAIPPARPDPLGAFVYQTGRNIALKQLRHRSAQKRGSRYETVLDELTELLPSDTPEQLLEAQELGRAVNAFLAALEPSARRLFLRRYWFGDSVQVLSRDTGLSENLVSVRLHRLRRKLKDYLYKEGFWDET